MVPKLSRVSPLQMKSSNIDEDTHEDDISNKIVPEVIKAPYEDFESIDFQQRVSEEGPIDMQTWLMYASIGISMGIVAFGVDLMVSELFRLKWGTTQEMLLSGGTTEAWLIYLGISVLFGGLASAMTVYYGPGAAGSGIAELMGYLNGIKVPGFISVNSLVTKVFGNVLAVSAGLAVGKEGPLAHIGAIVGQMMLYLPVKGYDQFHNENSKREASAAGAAAGVSAAFGAPIGGTLLAYEASRPNTFWSFSLMWKVFFSSCISTFTLNILTSAYEGQSLEFLNAGLIQFG